MTLRKIPEEVVYVYNHNPANDTAKGEQIASVYDAKDTAGIERAVSSSSGGRRARIPVAVVRLPNVPMQSVRLASHKYWRDEFWYVKQENSNIVLPIVPAAVHEALLYSTVTEGDMKGPWVWVRDNGLKLVRIGSAKYHELAEYDDRFGASAIRRKNLIVGNRYKYVSGDSGVFLGDVDIDSVHSTQENYEIINHTFSKGQSMAQCWSDNAKDGDVGYPSVVTYRKVVEDLGPAMGPDMSVQKACELIWKAEEAHSLLYRENNKKYYASHHSYYYGKQNQSKPPTYEHVFHRICLLTIRPAGSPRVVSEMVKDYSYNG